MIQNKRTLLTTLFYLTTSSIIALTACTKSKEFYDNDSSLLNTSETSSAALRLRTGKPNIIFILADDIGYEVPTYTGGQSYQTPNINMLAAQGMQFTHCYATPNCAPSRVELLSGKYNVRNYVDWAIYDTNQKTFVSYLKANGYKTCVAGKWQLDGGDASIRAMGFDKYLVHYPFTDSKGNDDMHRYKNPVLYSNGAYLPGTQTNGKYADDMFANYISQFVDSNKNNPFFVYFSLSLCHAPFSPTPDDPEFAGWNTNVYQSDIRFFPSMVRYMDKKVGQIVNKIKAVGLANNTYIVFCGDNGTHKSITSLWRGKTIVGGKETSREYGTHVPLVVYCPGKVAPGTSQAAIVDLSDMYRTVTNMGGVNSLNIRTTDATDSKSFYPYLNGNTPSSQRTWSYCYWKPNSKIKAQNKHFVQDTNYKLYDSTGNNAFYNIYKDTLEMHPLSDASLTPEEKSIKTKFQGIIKSMQPK
jgi:arylsulfatase A